MMLVHATSKLDSALLFWFWNSSSCEKFVIIRLLHLISVI
jgi:hypothetical protein